MMSSVSAQTRIPVLEIFPIEQTGLLHVVLHESALASVDWAAQDSLTLWLAELPIPVEFAGTGTACRAGAEAVDRPFLLLRPVGPPEEVIRRIKQQLAGNGATGQGSLVLELPDHAGRRRR